MSTVFHRSARAMRRTNDCPAIFVHAGAGYHSIQNEQVHLQACEDAAVAAMSVLRAGGKALEAIEMAIKVLEDREITNAGYGSNLAIDGTVEGDAVVVDHIGRSGGVGAMSNIKNPITVARKVLEATTQPLSLRRVPPNLIVGQGATDWAFRNSIPVLPSDALISPTARDRWNRWKRDLQNEEKKGGKRHHKHDHRQTPSDPPPEYEDPIREQMKREQSKVNRECVWNEGQPTSPPPPDLQPSTQPSTCETPSATPSYDSQARSRSPNSQSSSTEESIAFHGSHQSLAERSRVSAQLSKDLRNAADMHDAAGDDSTFESNWRSNQPTSSDRGQQTRENASDIEVGPHWADLIWREGSYTPNQEFSDDGSVPFPSLTPSPTEVGDSHRHRERFAFPLQGNESTGEASGDEEPSRLRRPLEVEEGREDLVTDTVGAIAIDNDGNIACGASSGGIGMKFRGRMGPAALVGVGAAVIPQDPEDRSRATTGVVTSGTGEHMGTTMAAQTCADRLYHSVRKRRGGGFEACEDDQAVKSFIETDFMGHPSVKESQSMGAIGVLAVKKTSYGIYLYFAHNTDSFALASMYADEPKPTCTMSRSHGNGMVAQGGRAMRYRQKW